jgi:DNA-binding transcriptional regulator YhcF (GntR family)
MHFAESNPIYLQIADLLSDGVLTGRYGPGERIPSVREMAVTIEVNPNTVQRTYATLQEWSVVETRRGQGYFVADDARGRTLQRKRRILVEQELPRIVDYLRVLEMPLDEFFTLCTETHAAADKTEEKQS